MLLRDRRSDLAGRGPDYRRGFAGKGVLAVGATRPVDRVLERSRNRPVVLRRHEQHGANAGDPLLERHTDRRIVLVEVGTVDRELPDRDLLKSEAGRRRLDQRLCELAIDRRAGQAADEVADGERGHSWLLAVWLKAQGIRTNRAAAVGERAAVEGRL